MYCHHCGKKRTDDAVYCSQCGRLLAAEEEAGETVSAEVAAGVSAPNALIVTESAEEPLYSMKVTNQRVKGSVWTWLMPLMLAVAVTASVFAYYRYQTGINDRVLKLQSEARTEALSGKYIEALASLKEAAAARPGFQAVQADLEMVNRVIELDRSLKSAGQQLEEQKLSEAEQALQQAKEELAGHDEPVYARLREQQETFQVKLGVMKITAELADLKTVDELEEKLNAAKRLDGEESASLQEQIVTRIVELCYEDALALLKSKDYTDALNVTARALAIAQDERLTELSERIEREQEQYEKAEQQRLEQAMQMAAAEDLKNQTAAVEVVNIVSTLDEFGDLNIEGELKNAATRPIYSITVQFTVYNAEGGEVGSGTALATPDYVEPGETMRFNGTVYGVYVEDTTVVVDHATWYLD